MRHPKASWGALAAALLPLAAQAAGPQLSVQQVQMEKGSWPRGMRARAWVNVVGASGSPIQGLGPDIFRVYEGGNSSSSKITKVETLESLGTGASIVLVIQASGAMEPICEELKKSASAFVNGLGEKDQVAAVDYAETAETIAPFSPEKGEVAGKVGKMTCTGKSFLLYDGLAQAVSLFAGNPGKGQQAGTLPAPKAIIVIADGRDNGSATAVEKVVSDATKRRIPIHAVGHSELDQDSLSGLEHIARSTGGTYRAAPTVEDVNKGLTVIKDYINKAYVIDWKTDLDHDGKEHKVEVAMESDSGPGLRGSLVVRTPDYFDWLRLAAWVAGILILVIAGAAIYVLTRPQPPPQRFCFVCKRAQMPDWDVCLFCLKSAKARLLVQKGMNKGKQYPLVGKVVSLGSGPENSIRLLDGAVSGKHAGVSIDDNKFEIVDLGSKNGVLVNGKRTPRRFLRNGDVITLGMTELKFESTAVGGGDEEADD
jgi:type III secretion system (T3SS) inner membrane Yop/YscD-like protein/von Willebrand factor type A domain-containing protein